MKKKRLKKWVSNLLAILFIWLIGIMFFVCAAINAKQIDRSMDYETNYSINN